MYCAIVLFSLVATPAFGVRATSHSESVRRFLKTCNPDNPDWKDIECVKSTFPAIYERRRPVALLSVGCTAWRLGPKNHMMTNNHCYNGDRRKVPRSTITFDHQHTSCGGRTTANTVKVRGGELLKNSRPLDYTLFTVRASDVPKIRQFGHFGLDLRVPTPGELVYVIHHTSKYARSNRKWVTTHYDHEANNPRCKWVRVVPENRRRRGESFCDISAGGSGSPVIAVASNKIISLNFGGYDQNDNRPEACAVKSHLLVDIWEEVKDAFNNQVPEGDAPGSTPPSSPPTTKDPGSTPPSSPPTTKDPGSPPPSSPPTTKDPGATPPSSPPTTKDPEATPPSSPPTTKDPGATPPSSPPTTKDPGATPPSLPPTTKDPGSTTPEDDEGGSSPVQVTVVIAVAIGLLVVLFFFAWKRKDEREPAPVHATSKRRVTTKEASATKPKVRQPHATRHKLRNEEKKHKEKMARKKKARRE